MLTSSPHGRANSCLSLAPSCMRMGLEKRGAACKMGRGGRAMQRTLSAGFHQFQVSSNVVSGSEAHHNYLSNPLLTVLTMLPLLLVSPLPDTSTRSAFAPTYPCRACDESSLLLKLFIMIQASKGTFKGTAIDVVRGARDDGAQQRYIEQKHPRLAPFHEISGIVPSTHRALKIQRSKALT